MNNGHNPPLSYTVGLTHCDRSNSPILQRFHGHRFPDSWRKGPHTSSPNIHKDNAFHSSLLTFSPVLCRQHTHTLCTTELPGIAHIAYTCLGSSDFGQGQSALSSSISMSHLTALPLLFSLEGVVACICMKGTSASPHHAFSTLPCLVV